VSVAAQNLVAMVTPVPEHGARIQELLSNYRSEAKDGALVVTLGDVYENEDKLLAFEVAMHARRPQRRPAAVHYRLCLRSGG